METPPAPVRKRRVGKPLGVVIVSAFDGIFIGLVPLIVLIVLDDSPSIKISGANYYLSAALHIAVVAAALGALLGENSGRLALLWVVSAVSILMIVNSAILLSGSAEGVSRGGFTGNIVRGVFWIAANWWYFNRTGVVEYYKQAKDR